MAARVYAVSLDLGGNELLNAVIQQVTAFPSSPKEGLVVYRSDEHQVYIYAGATAGWQKMEQNVAVTYGASGDIAASGPGDTAAAGATGKAADAGHRHARESFATTASTLTVGGTADGGSASTVARGDHAHAMPSFGTVTASTSAGASAASGTATTIARSDHTHGTPSHTAGDHSTISLSSLAAPTAALGIGGYRLTNVADPTSASDAATKGYVDGVATGLDFKGSVRVATTADITLSGTQTIDGVALSAGDRVLVKDQSTAADNGLYTVAAGSWSRTSDADSSAEVTPGMFTFVEEGATNGNTGFVLTTDGPLTLGSTALTFAIFNASAAYTAGNGLSLTGQAFAVNVQSGGGIVIVSDELAVDTAVVARKYATSIGNGSSLTYTVTHNLGTLDVIVQVYANSSGAQIEADVVHATTSTVTIAFNEAPTSNQYRVVCIG